MSTENTFVFAKITPHETFFESAKRALLGMLDATRQEPGCIRFDIHTSECGRYIYLYEEWISKNALENHHQEAHTQAVAQKFTQWLAAPTEVSRMKKL
ncbi:antibiotic biosynthesis monooxygenase [Photobacterium sp. CCB-ST2H9]|uniref:putative quinol monooxygenase n=1 Tax=Photobacterium sp. CCB-ST2H9 TaxID=2912855 RepID=UPI0020063921|nr:putative quinol monooxygenase [Photobacterium sp. CCB-ST2H9]UTM59746.1 antibiotic biosynthesis monooxygenase [Photobacterium sp. CCB-ST2H9]